LNVQDVEAAAVGTGIEGVGLTTTGREGRGLEQAADHRMRSIEYPFFALIAFILYPPVLLVEKNNLRRYGRRLLDGWQIGL
jgi:hypothetical protein